MKFCVLMGSPRLKGNTAELCKPFMLELKRTGSEVKYITLADKQIASSKPVMPVRMSTANMAVCKRMICMRF